VSFGMFSTPLCLRRQKIRLKPPTTGRRNSMNHCGKTGPAGLGFSAAWSRGDGSLSLTVNGSKEMGEMCYRNHARTEVPGGAARGVVDAPDA
jgi:hypothetical protein